MEKFDCDICGKKHKVVYAISVLEPDVLFNMTEKERNERVDNHEFMVVIDRSFILSKASLFIEIIGEKKFMYLEIWVKIDLSSFLKKEKELKGDQLEIEGTIFTSIPNYWDAEGEKVTLTFDLTGGIQLPIVKDIHHESQLGNDFLKGVSFKKVIDWSKHYYHS